MSNTHLLFTVNVLQSLYLFTDVNLTILLTSLQYLMKNRIYSLYPLLSSRYVTKFTTVLTRDPMSNDDRFADLHCPVCRRTCLPLNEHEANDRNFAVDSYRSCFLYFAFVLCARFVVIQMTPRPGPACLHIDWRERGISACKWYITND